MAKKAAKKATKPTPKEAIENYLAGNIPRKIGSFYRPEWPDGEKRNNHPLNKDTDGVNMCDWNQKAADAYLRSAVE